jgi:hypothetical protein
MRQLTVEELGFVSGGFGGMADQTIVDSELSFGMSSIYGDAFGFGDCRQKRRPKRKPKPPAPCRPPKGYVTREEGERCAQGFGQVNQETQMTLYGDGEIQAGGELNFFQAGLKGGVKRQWTSRLTTCVPNSTAKCQPEGYDIFDIGDVMGFEIEFGGC